LKAVDCYFCGGSSHAPYAEENGYSLVKCDGCGLLYVNPRPDDDAITAAMQTGQHRGEETLDRVGAFLDDKVAGYEDVLADLFPDESPAGRWLDIGCGHGEFLEALRWQFGPAVAAEGLEPCRPKAAAARARGLTIRDEDGAIEPESLDAISALNVYSHLPDPVATIARWSRWLRPGGSFVIQTGDSCNLPVRHHHQPFDLPDHLSFANQRIVRSILERAGLLVHTRQHYRHGGVPAWQLWRRSFRDMWLVARKR